MCASTRASYLDMTAKGIRVDLGVLNFFYIVNSLDSTVPCDFLCLQSFSVRLTSDLASCRSH